MEGGIKKKKQKLMCILGGCRISSIKALYSEYYSDLLFLPQIINIALTVEYSEQRGTCIKTHI